MTGCAASATATHTPQPSGAPGSPPCQPAPVPRANAITTTPPSASSFAAVTTFCTHRPDATPTTLIAVNSATSPAPSGAVSAEGQPDSRTRNSPAATPIAAIATPLVPRASTQLTTKPARGPNASRTKAYLPAARGCRVVSSAKHSAPRNASPAPSRSERLRSVIRGGACPRNVECARKNVGAQHAAPLHDNTADL